MQFTLAIPNYNGLPFLKNLIPQVVGEDFDDIFVLDDASTDESVEFLKEKFPSVKVIQGRKNVGPTANRNRILKRDFGDILVFLDHDMELLTENVASRIRDLFQNHPKAAVFGGLILSKEGEPMWYNRGYDLHPVRGGKSAVWHELALNFWDNTEVMNHIREKSGKDTLDFVEPKDGEVDWVAEGLFMVRGNLFEKMGGFDEKFKMFHEGPDFCKRANPKKKSPWTKKPSKGSKFRNSERRLTRQKTGQDHPWESLHRSE